MTNMGCPNAQDRAADKIDECNSVLAGAAILVAASTNGVALIDRQKGKARERSAGVVNMSHAECARLHRDGAVSQQH